jgi:hypothetical protein
VRALDARNALDLDLLADRRVGCVDELLDGLAVGQRAREQLVLASAALVATAWASTCSASSMKRSPLATKSVSQLTSTRVPTPSLDLGGDQAVGGRAALALGDALEALDAQDLGGLGQRRRRPRRGPS